MAIKIADLRQDYRLRRLLESEALADPIHQFQAWFEEAVKAELPEPNAMTLATITPENTPAARMVLLKHVDQRGFVFFTNYLSRKGQELAGNPHAALVFWWAELERQVRIEGVVSQITPEESDHYFQSRPIGSQWGAWASEQSQAIHSYATLETALEKIQAQYPHPPIPRPDHWGGYCLSPTLIEFWQGRPNRLHDRLCYHWQASAATWQMLRLSP